MEATIEKDEVMEGANGMVEGADKPENAQPTTVDELVVAVWQGDVMMPKGDAKRLVAEAKKVKFDEDSLVMNRIMVIDNGDGTMTFTRNNPKPESKVSHRYIMPSFTDDVHALVKQALDGGGMCNITLTGNIGTGKTEFVYELAKEFGVKVYQVNGSEGLTNADFYGTTQVGVDEKTKQNFTYFDKGPLYRAFIEGTKLDEKGDQVLDKDGEPIVVGKPAFFFLDEFAAMLPEVFLGVFNRAMEIPRENGRGRSIEITMDNGRVVKSHPCMVMFLAGNTVGTGNNGRYQMGFTAQGNKMDESTRNRITGFCRFGYSKKAEEEVATGMLNDDYEVARLMKFRDNVRNMFRNEKVETLFTTRSIVATCNVARTFRANGMKDWMANALRMAVLNGLPEGDRTAFNETVRTIWGVDFVSAEGRDKDYDFI